MSGEDFFLNEFTVLEVIALQLLSCRDFWVKMGLRSSFHLYAPAVSVSNNPQL